MGVRDNLKPRFQSAKNIRLLQKGKEGQVRLLQISAWKSGSVKKIGIDIIKYGNFRATWPWKHYAKCQKWNIQLIFMAQEWWENLISSFKESNLEDSGMSSKCSWYNFFFCLT